jgi:hypothetical protein
MTTELMQSIERERAARQQAWEAFVARCQHGATPVLLRHVADLMQGRTDPYYGTVQPWLSEAAQVFGWDGVIRGIAQAHHADERHRRELVDRR